MDCKHNSHCHSNSNNNMCKKKTLINHGRCKSKPKKLQQSHIISHGNNRLINHSPKTIDYLNGKYNYYLFTLYHHYSNEEAVECKIEQ